MNIKQLIFLWFIICVSYIFHSLLSLLLSTHLTLKLRINQDDGTLEKLKVDQKNETIVKLGNEYRIMDKNSARIERFWMEVILPPQVQEMNELHPSAYLKSVVRWDTFEENFINFLVSKMEFLLGIKRYKVWCKINLSKLVKEMYSQLATFQTNQNAQLVSEVIPHPQLCQQSKSPSQGTIGDNFDHSLSLAFYNGPVVTKSGWRNFAKSQSLKTTLISIYQSSFSTNQKGAETDDTNKSPFSPGSTREADSQLSINTLLERFKPGVVVADGIYKYACGSMYKGERKGFLKHGQGTYTSWNADFTFEGVFEQGVRSGEGKLRFSIKEDRHSVRLHEGTFEGTWELDQKQGTGRVLWDDKSEFHGQFEANQMAFGTFTWYDEKDLLNRYLGLFKNFRMTGTGSHYEGGIKRTKEKKNDEQKPLLKLL